MKRTLQAFTRVELVASVAAVALLGCTTLPLLAATRGSSDRAGCFNNLRQLGIALLSYADDNGGTFPPRGVRPFWPERLRPYYKQMAILTCPSDGLNPQSVTSNPTNIADAAPRSYIFNGWNDYFSKHGLPLAQPFPESAIAEPAQTILFGEKVTDSGHFWFDYDQIDDLTVLENGRHFRSGNNGTSGASNHAFADGSVRLLKWGAAFQPVNLWAIEPEFRTFQAPP
jgi:hypothetical protein